MRSTAEGIGIVMQGRSVAAVRAMSFWCHSKRVWSDVDKSMTCRWGPGTGGEANSKSELWGGAMTMVEEVHCERGSPQG